MRCADDHGFGKIKFFMEKGRRRRNSLMMEMKIKSGMYGLLKRKEVVLCEFY